MNLHPHESTCIKNLGIILHCNTTNQFHMKLHPTEAAKF